MTTRSPRVTLVRQSEAGECGLACLAMLLAAHHAPHTLRELRGRVPVGLLGMTMLDIVRAGETLGLLARAVKVPIGSLHKLRLPAILHWDMRHFVVLAEVGRRHVVVLDPARGRQRLDLDELAGHFTGVAGEFVPSSSLAKRPSPPRLRLTDVFGLVAGMRGSLAKLGALSLALQFAFVGVPVLTQVAIDEAVSAGDASLAWVVGGGLAGLVALRVLLGLAHGMAATHLAATLDHQSARSLMRHLLRLPLAFYEARHAGDVHSRFTALGQIQSGLTTVLVSTWIDGALVLGLGAAMFSYSPTLAWVVVAGMAGYFALRAVYYGPMKRLQEQLAIRSAEETTALVETLRAIRGIKVFGRTQERARAFDELVIQRVNTRAKAAGQLVGFNALNTAIFGLVDVVVLLLLVGAVMAGSMTLGMMFAFLAFEMQFVQRASSFVDGLLALRLLDVPLERVSDIALAAPEPAPQQTATPQALQGAARNAAGAQIVVTDASFSYPGGGVVFSSLSFTAHAGELLAIAGRSGSGKTSLVKALCGLSNLDRGRIVKDGSPVSVATREHAIADIGVVLQDDFLLSGTLAQNISFFEFEPDHQQIQEAARLAQVLDDIQAMPMGFSTFVTDMGSALSSGQRQRILLARALYRRPRLLLLDEATSALDVPTERAVLHALRQTGCTIVMVAHRPDAIAAADRVLKLHSCGAVEISNSPNGSTADSPGTRPVPSIEPTLMEYQEPCKAS